MVIGVGEGPAAADRHEPRVANLWKDHGGTSICDGATRPVQCVASGCSTRGADDLELSHSNQKEGRQATRRLSHPEQRLLTNSGPVEYGSSRSAVTAPVRALSDASRAVDTLADEVGVAGV